MNDVRIPAIRHAAPPTENSLLPASFEDRRWRTRQESFDPQLQDDMGDIVAFKEEPRRFYFNFVKATNDRVTAELAGGEASPMGAAMRAEFAATLAFG